MSTPDVSIKFLWLKFLWLKAKFTPQCARVLISKIVVGAKFCDQKVSHENENLHTPPPPPPPRNFPAIRYSCARNSCGLDNVLSACAHTNIVVFVNFLDCMHSTSTSWFSHVGDWFCHFDLLDMVSVGYFSHPWSRLLPCHGEWAQGCHLILLYQPARRKLKTGDPGFDSTGKLSSNGQPMVRLGTRRLDRVMELVHFTCTSYITIHVSYYIYTVQNVLSECLKCNM